MTTISNAESPDPTLRTTLAAVAACALGAVVLAGFTCTLRVTLGVTLGAVAAVGNLWLVARVGAALLSGGSRGWLAAGAVKLVVLLGGVYALHRWGGVELLAVMAGYAVLPLGVVLAGLRPAQGVAAGAERSR